MIRRFSLVLLLILSTTSVLFAESPGPSRFAKEVLDWHQNHCCASASYIASGMGSYRLTESKHLHFNWVAYQNSDAYFQIEMDTRIYGFDLRPLRRIKDVIDRPYETGVENGNGVYSDAGWITWIGLSNDWAFDEEGYGEKSTPFCKGPSQDYACDMDATVQYYLAKLTAASPALNFHVDHIQKQ